LRFINSQEAGQSRGEARAIGNVFRIIAIPNRTTGFDGRRWHPGPEMPELLRNVGVQLVDETLLYISYRWKIFRLMKKTKIRRLSLIHSAKSALLRMTRKCSLEEVLHPGLSHHGGSQISLVASANAVILSSSIHITAGAIDTPFFKNCPIQGRRD
jgi:hypothetical protein